jgi:major type 1 subunit fimbrin (pilin)
MLAAALGLAIAPAASYASDGKIDFTGTVTANTCTVTAGDNKVLAVELPSVNASALAVAGAKAGPKQFTIELSACTGTSTKAHAYFEPGPTVDVATGNLKNDGGTATNVQIGLFNPDQTAISLNRDDTTQGAAEITLTKTGTNPAIGSGKINYFAAYLAKDGAATAGTVKSSVTYTLMYK